MPTARTCFVLFTGALGVGPWPTLLPAQVQLPPGSAAVARAESLLAGLRIDGTTPLDTLRLARALAMVERTADADTSSTVRFQSSDLLFRTALRLMVQRMAYPIAAHLLLRATAYDPQEVHAPDSYYWLGVATYRQLELLDPEIRKSPYCDARRHQQDLIVQARKAFTRGRAKNPTVASAYLRSLDRFGRAGACWQRGSEGRRRGAA